MRYKHSSNRSGSAKALVRVNILLRNRCAYLISGSNEEREAILRDFQQIYNVRSSIVHAGKKRLNSEEHVLLEKLRRLCRRVISKEIGLLNNETHGDA